MIIRYSKDVVYELTISVSGCIIGRCDINVELLNLSYGRVLVHTPYGLQITDDYYEYIRFNFTLSKREKEGAHYLLELNDSYSLFTLSMHM